MSHYDLYQAALHPTWLANTVGEEWASALGIVKDGIEESMISAIKCRFVTTCPADALPYVGQERALERLPNEATDSYRTRLKGAWDAWTYAGTKTGVLNAVTLLGFTNAQVKENADWAWPPSPGYAPGAEWWRFWVVIPQPHPFNVAWVVGDGTSVGSGRPIGLTGDPQLFAALKGAVAKWKAAHAQLVNIILILSGKLVGNTWNVGDGTTVGGNAIYASI